VISESGELLPIMARLSRNGDAIYYCEEDEGFGGHTVMRATINAVINNAVDRNEVEELIVDADIVYTLPNALAIYL
jgi:hypothetical protein